MINVLVVDDSAFFRTAISRMLASDPGIQIVGIARDGDEALEQVRKLKPDVITLDIEMPRRDGLSTLQVIMAEMPMPVIMVSSLTVEGAEATLKALELGAMDFIPKYQGSSVAHLDVAELSNDLCTKVKAVVSRARRFPIRSRPLGGTFAGLPSTRTGAPRLTTPPPPPPRVPVAPRPRLRTGRPNRDIVAIGVSTGGPPAVQKVLSAFPEDFPACIFIAQHMPGTFTGPFAKRLDNVSRLTVNEAENGDKIQNGMVYVCPGGKHLRIDMRGALPHLSVVTEPAAALYKPSASVLMESVGQCMGSRSVGVIMTGMGSDGLEGMKILKSKGGVVLAQNEASCVVYGMPKAIVDAGLADEVVDLEALPDAIMAALYK
ncbi:MAG: chemotaxis response regulator protein-glutamate methylesterase [Bilophila sp.]